MSFKQTYCNINGYKVRVPERAGKYEIKKIIDKGGFAVIALGQEIKTDKLVAIKIIGREYIIKNNIMMYLDNELRLSSRFDHPNIVKVYDIIYEEDIIMIVMEYLKNGDLQSVLMRGYQFTLEIMMKITKGILEGLNYLHKRGICHRDIKSENILFDDEFNPKIIDFGVSMEHADSAKTICGTPFFMAPEIIRGENYDGRKADIWALGVTLHVLTTKTFPWEQTKSEAQFLNKLANNKIEIILETNGFIGQIIRSCLIWDPNMRASAQDLLDYIERNFKTHKYISKIDFKNNNNSNNSIVSKRARIATPVTRNQIHKRLRLNIRNTNAKIL